MLFKAFRSVLVSKFPGRPSQHESWFFTIPVSGLHNCWPFAPIRFTFFFFQLDPSSFISFFVAFYNPSIVSLPLRYGSD